MTVKTLRVQGHRPQDFPFLPPTVAKTFGSPEDETVISILTNLCSHLLLILSYWLGHYLKVVSQHLIFLSQFYHCIVLPPRFAGCHRRPHYLVVPSQRLLRHLISPIQRRPRCLAFPSKRQSHHLVVLPPIVTKIADWRKEDMFCYPWLALHLFVITQVP